jgi:hypothetical protein
MHAIEPVTPMRDFVLPILLFDIALHKKIKKLKHTFHNGQYGNE